MNAQMSALGAALLGLLAVAGCGGDDQGRSTDSTTGGTRVSNPGPAGVGGPTGITAPTGTSNVGGPGSTAEKR